MSVQPHPFEPIFGGPPAVGEADCQVCQLPQSNWRHQDQTRPLSMYALDALSFAILALNDSLDPNATEPDDRARLDDESQVEAALDSLDRLRTFVRSLTTI